MQPTARPTAPPSFPIKKLTSAFVLLDRNAAAGLGHVAGCFEERDRDLICFSDDGPSASPQFWTQTLANQDQVLSLFKGIGYTDWKRLDVEKADPAQALVKLNEVKDLEYNIVNRNDQNDVYDVLHDEGSGYGITANLFYPNNGCYIGWVQSLVPGASNWFDNDIAATASGVFRSALNEQCVDDKYCDSGLSCCNGTCKAKVEWFGIWLCP